MSSGTDPPATKLAVRTPAVLEPLPGILRGFYLTLQLDCLYDLDKDIADVIGLRAIQPDATVVKVMSIPNNGCVRVVIPDNNVGTHGFHEIIIHDMADADAPDVPVSELGCLRLDWPQAVLSYMGRYQKDLENLRHECRERFGSVQSGLCTHSRRFGLACCSFSFRPGSAVEVPGNLVHCVAWHDTGLCGSYASVSYGTGLDSGG